MAVNYRGWSGAAMNANCSRKTDKCGVAASFSRLAVIEAIARYTTNRWAGAAMAANIC
jgi:hypothetical protein